MVVGAGVHAQACPLSFVTLRACVHSEAKMDIGFQAVICNNPLCLSLRLYELCSVCKQHCAFSPSYEIIYVAKTAESSALSNFSNTSCQPASLLILRFSLSSRSDLLLRLLLVGGSQLLLCLSSRLHGSVPAARWEVNSSVHKKHCFYRGVSQK